MENREKISFFNLAQVLLFILNNAVYTPFEIQPLKGLCPKITHTYCQ